jgi:hypothetical protein
LMMSFISLVKFSPRFFLFEAIRNEIVFLISFLACVLLVYRLDTDFCM